MIDEYKRSMEERRSRSSTVNSLSAQPGAVSIEGGSGGSLPVVAFEMEQQVRSSLLDLQGKLIQPHSEATSSQPQLHAMSDQPSMSGEKDPSIRSGDEIRQDVSKKTESSQQGVDIVNNVVHAADVDITSSAKSTDCSLPCKATAVQSAPIDSPAFTDAHSPSNSEGSPICKLENYSPKSQPSSYPSPSTSSGKYSLPTHGSPKSLMSLDSTQAELSYQRGSFASLSSFDQSEEPPEDATLQRVRPKGRKVKASTITFGSTEKSDDDDSDSKIAIWMVIRWLYGGTSLHLSASILGDVFSYGITQ